MLRCEDGFSNEGRRHVAGSCGGDQSWPRGLPGPAGIYKSAYVQGEFDMPNTQLSANSTGLTAEIVAAYVANNPVPSANLADLIATVHSAVSGLSRPAIPAVVAPTPAVNPKRSVFPDYIVSLEDGRKFKSMKRHLGLLGLTPDEYRAKWGLPRDYPMVAPNYAAARSELAKKAGLGRKPGKKLKSKAPVKQKAPAKAKRAKRA
jgi:predicted transcriptional regulator